jgi:hypothetical protein
LNCNECNKEFPSAKELSQHRKEEHGIKKIKIRKASSQDCIKVKQESEKSSDWDVIAPKEEAKPKVEFPLPWCEIQEKTSDWEAQERKAKVEPSECIKEEEDIRTVQYSISSSNGIIKLEKIKKFKVEPTQRFVK